MYPMNRTEDAAPLLAVFALDMARQFAVRTSRFILFRFVCHYLSASFLRRASGDVQ